MFQIRTVLSQLAVASHDPSGAIATAYTGFAWPVRVARRVPSVLQIRTVLSQLAVASHDPSGRDRHPVPRPVAGKGSQGVPSTLQIRAVLSQLAVASHDPSGAIATAATPSPWPVRVAEGVPSTLQIRAVLSQLAVASQVPSGAIATAPTGSACPVRVLTSRSGGLLVHNGMTQGKGLDRRRCQRHARSCTSVNACGYVALWPGDRAGWAGMPA